MGSAGKNIGPVAQPGRAPSSPYFVRCSQPRAGGRGLSTLKSTKGVAGSNPARSTVGNYGRAGIHSELGVGPGWVEQSRLSLQTDPGTSEPGAELIPYPPVPAFHGGPFIHMPGRVERHRLSNAAVAQRVRAPDPDPERWVRLPSAFARKQQPGARSESSSVQAVRRTGAASGVHPSPSLARPVRAEGGGLLGRRGFESPPARAPRRSGPPGRIRPVIVCQTIPHGEHRRSSSSGRPENPAVAAGRDRRVIVPRSAVRGSTFPATRYPVIRRHGTSSTAVRRTGAASGVHPSPSLVRPARAEGGGLPGRRGFESRPARAPCRSGPPGRIRPVIVSKRSPWENTGRSTPSGRPENPAAAAGRHRRVIGPRDV